MLWNVRPCIRGSRNPAVRTLRPAGATAAHRRFFTPLFNASMAPHNCFGLHVLIEIGASRRIGAGCARQALRACEAFGQVTQLWVSLIVLHVNKSTDWEGAASSSSSHVKPCRALQEPQGPSSWVARSLLFSGSSGGLEAPALSARNCHPRKGHLPLWAAATSRPTPTSHPHAYHPRCPAYPAFWPHLQCPHPDHRGQRHD